MVTRYGVSPAAPSSSPTTASVRVTLPARSRASTNQNTGVVLLAGGLPAEICDAST